MDKLVQSLGITTLSKSQVSVMAKELDGHVAEFRARSLVEAGRFTFVASDALVLKVREGCVVPVHALNAGGAPANSYRVLAGPPGAVRKASAATPSG
jgi:putative transposase